MLCKYGHRPVLRRETLQTTDTCKLELSQLLGNRIEGQLTSACDAPILIALRNPSKQARCPCFLLPPARHNFTRTSLASVATFGVDSVGLLGVGIAFQIVADVSDDLGPFYSKEV